MKKKIGTIVFEYIKENPLIRTYSWLKYLGGKNCKVIEQKSLRNNNYIISLIFPDNSIIVFEEIIFVNDNDHAISCILRCDTEDQSWENQQRFTEKEINNVY